MVHLTSSSLPSSNRTFFHSSPLSSEVNLTSEFLISNFRRVLNVVCFLLGNSPASEFYVPTFRNTLFHLHRRIGTYRYLSAYEDSPLSSEVNITSEFLISNFRRVLNVVCFLLGNSRASEFYVPTFRNTLSLPSS